MPQDVVGMEHDEDEEQYVSSEDSDFAPEDAADASSESGDDAAPESSKTRQPVAGDNAGPDDYNNSGDEAIIERGRKRKKKSKDKGGDAEDEEGGEGGFVKTRRQRAVEKEERRFAAATGPVTVDVDALWQQMISGTPATADSVNDAAKDDMQVDGHDESLENTPKKADPARSAATTSGDDPSGMIRIKRTYNFAGQVHTEEKLVARDSAEAKLYLASNGDAIPEDSLPTKRVTKKAFRSAFEPLMDPLPQRADLNLGMAARMQAGRDAQAKKLNTVEKSRMDWAGYVDKEGIKDELELASKSKGSFTAREDFLARSEARRDEDARRARLAGRT